MEKRMLMRYFGSVNNTLQQYDDKSDRNTKSVCSVTIAVSVIVWGLLMQIT